MTSCVGLLLVIGTFSVVVSETDTVNIGAILNLETINGKVSTIAMKIVVDDVNSDLTILPAKTLSLSFHDANSSGFLSIVGDLKLRMVMVTEEIVMTDLLFIMVA
ncbi:hypothetical protein L2E82_50096 [Cichorium intybus]|nr:hypothetical protein L2E82_50096 [Cichorium intybus]